MFENRESKTAHSYTNLLNAFRSSNRRRRQRNRNLGELLEDRRLLTDLFVAMDGDDTNSGAMDAPFATLAAAIQAADPGDVINLREGTYAGNVTINEPNITVQGYADEHAIVQSSAFVEDEAWVIRFGMEGDGGRLNNLELVGGYYYVVKTESNWNWGLPKDQRQGTTDIIIENSRLHGSGRDVIKITPGGDDIIIRNNEIFNSGVRYSGNAEGIDNVNGDRMIVRDNYIHDIATTGIYFKGGSTDTIVERNRIENTGLGGVLVGFYTDVEWFDEDANPDYYESINGVVRNNVIVNTGGSGIGIYASKDALVYNNTLVNVGRDILPGIITKTVDHWFDAQTVTTEKNVNPTFINNIVVLHPDSTQNIAHLPHETVDGDIQFHNNIYWHESGNPRFVDSRADRFVWTQTYSEWAQTTGETGGALIDPQLDDIFHLSPDSPAIDAGQENDVAVDDYDTGTRSGTADIGADDADAGPAREFPHNGESKVDDPPEDPPVDPPTEDPGPGITLFENTLFVIGTDEVRDRVTIRESRGELRVRLNKDSMEFPVIDVQAIMITTDDGADSIEVSLTTEQDVVVHAGADKDRVRVRNLGPTEIMGGPGNDNLTGGNGPNIIYGEDGNDRINGGKANDTLMGGPGNDTILSKDGDDAVSGDAGNDILTTGRGNDFVRGGEDNDRIRTDQGDDIVLGETGNDNINGGSGRDLMIGGMDADRISGAAQEDIAVSGFTTYDDQEADLLKLHAEWTGEGDLNDRVDRIQASDTPLFATVTGLNTLTGGAEFATVFDDAERDRISGGAGKDWIFADDLVTGTEYEFVSLSGVQETSRNLLDIDNNGATNPLVDGVLVIRFLAGFTGQALTNGITTDPGEIQEITDFLNAMGPTTFDIDGDGEATALSDGLLVTRQLAGFTGDTLTSAANPRGLRASETAINARVEQLAEFSYNAARPIADEIDELFGNGDSILD